MRFLLFLFLTSALLGCRKSEISTPLVYSEVNYKMRLTMQWTSPQFTIPASAHVTALFGIIHSRDTFLWKENFLASSGLEDVAEVGNTTKINIEADAIIAGIKARSKFQLPPPSITGSAETTLSLSTVFSNVSFASMIAPSPDWFMGISNISLIKDNKWIDSLTIPVMIYDAGTEDGDIFGYNNPATTPQQPVKPLTPLNGSVLANGNASIGPIAVVRFTKL